MSLSAKGTKALADLQMNASILYGQDYFTEDEWIQLDGLVHKGQYVWTRGPTTAAITPIPQESGTTKSLQEPAIRTAIRTLQTATAMNGQLVTPAPNPTPSKQLAIQIGEQPIAAAHMDTQARIPPMAGQTSQHQSQATLQTDPVQGNPEVQSSQVMSSSVQKPRDTSPSPSKTMPTEERNQLSGGLPLGYTQAQLDEVKAFNEWMKNSKGRSSWHKSSEHARSGVSESQFATEKDSWTHSWRENVATQKRTLSPSVPPRRPSPNNSTITPEEMSYLAAAFKVRNGRSHKALTDIWQPKNPTFWTNKALAELRSNPPIGTLLVAQKKVTPNGQNRLELHIGDQIEVIRQDKSSPIGKNLRTGKPGYVNLDNCRRNGALMLASVVSAPPKLRASNIKPPSAHPLPAAIARMDSAERRNARAWEEEDDDDDEDDFVVPKKTISASVAQDKAKPHSSSMRVSRFMALADMDDGLATLEQTEKLPLTSANVAAATSPPSRIRTGVLRDEPLDIVPKTETCWFWATGKGCRFAPDECRDLHAYTANSTGANFYKGKPTWGALADYLPPSDDAHPNSNGALAPSPIESDERVFEQTVSPSRSNTHATSLTTADPASPSQQRSKFMPRAPPFVPGAPTKLPSHALTCYYWATPGTECKHADSECKYVHGPSPYGVATQLTCHFWANTGHCKYTDKECYYLHGWSSGGIAPPPTPKTTTPIRNMDQRWRDGMGAPDPEVDARTWASEVEEEENAKTQLLPPKDEVPIHDPINLEEGPLMEGEDSSQNDLVDQLQADDQTYEVQAETAVEVDMNDDASEAHEAGPSDTEQAEISEPPKTEDDSTAKDDEVPSMDELDAPPEIDPYIAARWEGPGGWDLEDLQEGRTNDPNFVTSGW